MPETISFFVPGTPVPQGSTKAFLVNGKPRITHGNAKTMPWRERIAHEAMLAAKEYEKEHGKPFFAPQGVEVSIVVVHRFSPPKSKVGKWLYPMVSRPDVDKCIRADFDALTNIIFHDDCQINRLVSTKEYCTHERPMAGLEVTITIGEERYPNPDYVRPTKRKS